MSKPLNEALGMIETKGLIASIAATDAMSKAVFVLGPAEGLRLLDSFPGMSAIIVNRKPDGSLTTVMSPRLRSAFHPVPRT